jgi:hypothetical protein
MNAPITPQEVIDQFFHDLLGILSLYEGETVDGFDAIAAASPTATSRGQLLAALVREEFDRRKAAAIIIDGIA